jgi:hypothetical protein
MLTKKEETKIDNLREEYFTYALGKELSEYAKKHTLLHPNHTCLYGKRSLDGRR